MTPGESSRTSFENPWRILAPLASDGSDSPHRQGMKRAARLADPVSKVLFRRRMDTPVRRFFRNYRRSFSNLDFGSLYELEDVPWGEGKRGRKELYFRGGPTNGRYRLERDTRLIRPGRPGYSSHLFSILPQGSGFLLENRRRINLSSLTERSLHEGIRRFLVFMDFAARGLTDRKRRRDAYESYVRRGFPNLSALLDRHFTVRSLGTVDTAPSGRTVNRVEVSVRARKDSFFEEYPEIHRLLEDLLEPTDIRVTFSDTAGDRIFEYERDGVTWTTRYATRGGRLYPVDPETGAVLEDGIEPLEARRSGLRVRVSGGVNLLGMRFGMEDFRARGRYEDGTMTWHPTDRPTLDLPAGFHLILSPFIDPFLDYLYNGEDGRGVRYREGFRSTESGVVRWEDVRLPLKDSPIVTFFLKLNLITLEAYDEASRGELDEFGWSVSEALRKDFRAELDS